MDALAPASRIGHPANGSISLLVNGKERQRADLSEMIWSVPEQIEYLSGYYTIEPGDLIFSIDNVVAAVSLSDKLWVVMIGVAIGILTMRFAAGIFSYAVQKEPILQQAAYILVLNIGVELTLSQLWHVEIPDMMRFGISVATILLSLLYAHSPFLQRFRFVLTWLAQGIGIVNEFVDWVLAPLRGLLRAVSLVFKPAAETEAT